jgi:hypothetical protein
VEPLGPEVVVELELEEQLPKLPLTLDATFTLCVFEELLHVYAIVVLGVVVLTNVAATKIRPIIIKLFMLVIMILNMEEIN